MSRRGAVQTNKATDRLNMALAKISAASAILDTIEAMSDRAVAMGSLKKQIDEGVEEGYAAVSDIKRAIATV